MSCDLPDSASPSTCTAKPQFSLLSVLILTAIWACLLKVQSWQSMIVVSVVLLTWLFGCQRTKSAVQAVVPALFIPGILICLFFVARGNSWALLLHAPVVPGALPMMMMMPFKFDWPTLLAAGAVHSSMIFLVAVTTIRFFAYTRDGVIVGSVLLSVLSGLLATYWTLYIY